MWLTLRENSTDRFVLAEPTPPSVPSTVIRVSRLEELLSNPGFDGILWDNKGLKRVLTRDILQEGLDTYLAAYMKPRGPIASHVGVFLWDQTISHEESDQR